MPPRRRRAQQERPAEKETDFEKTFRDAAHAAGFVRQFHVIDTGADAAVRAAIGKLTREGDHETAGMLRRIGRTRVTSVGYPDYTLGHSELGIIMAELKGARRGAAATAEQIEWLRIFAISLRPPDNQHAPSRAHLWFPRHWPAIETQFGLVTAPTNCECEICDWLYEREQRYGGSGL